MSAIPEIIEWSKSLPPWQQDAIRRLLVKHELDEKDKKEILAMAKFALGVPVDGEVPTPMAATLETTSGEKTPDTPIVLQAIEGVRDVNQIPTDAALPFAHAGLTVIYGQNGSGKSGYARVMKRACSARDKDEPVLPNVFAEGKVTSPTAVFRVKVGDKPDVLLKWREGDKPPSELGSVLVFDSRCARIIVNNKNEVQYQPYGIDVVEKLAGVLLWVQESISQAKPTPPEIRDSMVPDQSQAAAWLKKVAGDTDDVELGGIATWTLEREKALVELASQIAMLSSGDSTKEVERLTTLSSRLSSLRSNYVELAKGLDDLVLLGVGEVTSEHNNAVAARDQWAKELTVEEPLSGAGTSSPWRDLYVAAREYSIKHAYPNHDFPYIEDGSKCVLCQQSIGQEARERFARFKKFMDSTVEARVTKAKAALEERRRSFQALSIPSPDAIGLTCIGADAFDSELSAAFIKGFALLGSRKAEALSRLSGAKPEPVEPFLASVDSRVDSVISAISDAVVSLQAGSKPEELAKLKARFAEEQAWKALSARYADVRARRDALKIKGLCEAGIRSLRPTAITLKAKELVTTTMTPLLRAALAAELQAIGWNRAPIDIRTEGREGTTRTQLLLGEAKALAPITLGDVLSEGEHRALGIAGFLAEVAVSEKTQPIVFDDPVSSLDHLFTQAIAKRLVVEGAKRQVIVFTHDLALLVELQGAQEALALTGVLVPMATVTISRRAAPGIAEMGHPWEGKRTGERVQELSKELADIKALHVSDNSQYNIKAAALYSRLREAWEMLVEQDLLDNVVTRWRVSVGTQQLDRVLVEDSDVNRVEMAMTKASRFMVGHATSLNLSVQRPAPDEVSKDLAALGEFAIELRQRKEKVRKERKKKLEPVPVNIG